MVVFDGRIADFHVVAIDHEQIHSFILVPVHQFKTIVSIPGSLLDQHAACEVSIDLLSEKQELLMLLSGENQ